MGRGDSDGIRAERRRLSFDLSVAESAVLGALVEDLGYGSESEAVRGALGLLLGSLPRESRERIYARAESAVMNPSPTGSTRRARRGVKGRASCARAESVLRSFAAPTELAIVRQYGELARKRARSRARRDGKVKDKSSGEVASGAAPAPGAAESEVSVKPVPGPDPGQDGS